ncbi:arsenite inducuble rna associated protein aip-1-related [Holotrichia oblita]|uniref:Arsenite inducuble rna associated protein aip-1-related n=1 Tax=Holotrichia oblita TaxID=644536 RepID=A0ACB9TKX8_HOLOL|nr:arsenite inducuble rna associated protein aip-1-related [Holotrichia oblita]
MEFPYVGKQCDHPQCKQLEFLPLKCKCDKVFCPDHFNQHVQICESTASNIVTHLKKIEETYQCCYNGCKSTSIVPLICDKCQKHFCIKHRHINECAPLEPAAVAEAKQKILAPIQQFNEAKASVDRELDKNLENAKKKVKNQETANKVQLMRIKNKATGLKSVPLIDRVYFNVHYPTSIASKVVPIFVSKTWSIGKAIDAIAQEFKIPNNNNQTVSQKLRLFKVDDGHILTSTMSEKVEELLNTQMIINGQSLKLEYVSDECLSLN